MSSTVCDPRSRKSASYLPGFGWVVTVLSVLLLLASWSVIASIPFRFFRPWSLYLIPGFASLSFLISLGSGNSLGRAVCLLSLLTFVGGMGFLALCLMVAS